MRCSARVGVVAAVLGSTLTCLPVLSQVGLFSFGPPDARVAEAGAYTVRWLDSPVAIPNAGHVPSVTWYYSRQQDGSERQRMVSLFADDFSRGLGANWRADGPFAFDWKVAREQDRAFVVGPRDGSALIGLQPTERDVVVSTLVRPRGVLGRFAVGLRTQPNGSAYQLTQDKDGLALRENGLALRPPIATSQLLPGRWYWFEIGIRSHPREVELRLRVFDEARKNVLFCMGPLHTRPSDRNLLRTGLVTLSGSADFSTIYVDPWQARWLDDVRNEFRWDTSGVPAGSYYLVAELCADRQVQRIQVSEYQVEVRNPEPDVRN